MSVDKDTKKIVVVIGIVLGIIVVAGGGLVLLIGSSGDNSNNGNEDVTNSAAVPADSNSNSGSIENTNLPPSLTVNEELIVEGRVFIKGYKTPSESYGISMKDGNEIGLGKYDSMKEQFRPYTGERVEVTFEKVCRSSSATCCRTLFYYCGTVKSWKPLEE